MKPLPCIALLISLSCNNPKSSNPITPSDSSKNSNSPNPADTSWHKTPEKIDRSAYYTHSDSITIADIDGEKIKYSKKDFNEIVDNFPTLYDSFPEHPDLSYVRSGIFREFIDSRGHKQKIIDIYRDINQIFRSLGEGGTYFGHQYYRSSGKAEYSVYLYRSATGYYQDLYNFDVQKRLFMAALRNDIRKGISRNNALTSRL
ncbi:MAG TPA: hypothetical protein VNS58_07930 [Puia sp.]|nr:hypothetical protein [Puia sp.]